MTPRILSAPTISTVLVRLTGPVCWIVLNAHFHSSEKSNVLRFSCHVWFIPIRCIRIYKPSSSAKRINWQMRDGMNLWEMRPGWDRACSSSLISFSSLESQKNWPHVYPWSSPVCVYSWRSLPCVCCLYKECDTVGVDSTGETQI